MTDSMNNEEPTMYTDNLPPCEECRVEDSVLELLTAAITHLETAAQRAKALGECLRSAREAMIDARGRVSYLRLQKQEATEWNKRGAQKR